MRPEVAVVHNSSNVIKDKVTGQWVPIHDCAQQEEPRVYQCSSSIEDGGSPSIFGSLIIRSVSGGWAMTIGRWRSTMWLVLWVKNLVVVVVIIVVVVAVMVLRRRRRGPATIARGRVAFEAVMPHASLAWQQSYSRIYNVNESVDIFFSDGGWKPTEPGRCPSSSLRRTPSPSREW